MRQLVIRKPFGDQVEKTAVLLERPVVAAPMAGITDSSFRRILREFGAALTYTEMVSGKALYYKNEKTKDLLAHTPTEAPIFVQLFGSDPQILAEQAALLQHRFQGIDINMGCPMPKITSNGEGSALLGKPQLAYDILYEVSHAVDIPVTVKIRKGIGFENCQAVEIAMLAEKAGAAAITVHGRTAAQLYSGQADWSVIKKVKEAVSIPVIGNGDVTDGASCLRMLEETGCDAVMVGRASRGNPWVFSNICAALDGLPEPPRPSEEEVLGLCMRHARMMVSEKGEYTGIHEMRQHLLSYLKGLPHAAQKKQALMQVTTLEELSELLYS